MFFLAYYSFVVFTAKTLVFGKCNFCVFFRSEHNPIVRIRHKKRLRIFVGFFSILKHSSILQLVLQKFISPKLNKSRCCFEIINRLMAVARYRRHLIIDFLLQKYIDQYFKIKNLFPIIIYSHRKQSQSFGFHRFGSEKKVDLCLNQIYSVFSAAFFPEQNKNKCFSPKIIIYF